ncbi:MAG: sugar phosphate isomerase/epimerase [Sulfolobales archaeon]|nr:sugar phosphate isomerase/epimerase [Sulfolobales archaeon]MCX8209108.1 sugar phosphate isomerase/epimerase [Sulfolobales archaeon]MDW8010388.1 sugar phosphate isomerase/epimerase [Sulfolobales archaeon]
MPKLSVSTMIYLGLPPSKAIERIASRGFRALELSYSNFLASGTREFSELGRVADTASSYSLEAFSVHLPYDRYGTDELSLASTTSRFYRWVRALDKLSVNFYVVHLPSFPPTEKFIQVAAKFVDSIASSVSGGSWVLVENTTDVPHVGSSVSGIASVLERANSLSVGVCVDVGHALITRTPLEDFRARLGGLVKAVHIHDNDGFSDTHLLPGRGILRLSDLVEFVASAKPPYAVAEVACGRLSECDFLLNGVRELRSVLGSFT